MRVDLTNRRAVPVHIVATTLSTQRPDIVMWYDSKTRVDLVFIELRVPWEENIERKRVEESHERKRNKYEELMEECQDKGLAVWCQPVEVGGRGFVGQSVWIEDFGLIMCNEEREEEID